MRLRARVKIGLRTDLTERDDRLGARELPILHANPLPTHPDDLTRSAVPPRPSGRSGTKHTHTRTQSLSDAADTRECAY